ncbi:MAG: CHASE3 domain-containing protein [Trichocoleus desertorum ATA4-8-CV12]|jgi:signal transduction histidine kinase/PAS domain-containing protein|nr:CHASE3 domain-containing protein [Trichocoleus desertorum ATA4-8-CV12]
MSKILHRRITLYFALGLAVLGINVAVSYYHIIRLVHNNALVTHSQEVIITLERMLSTLKDAETGQRGYLLTGSSSYLQPYNSAIAQIYQRVEQLQTLTSDNASQQQRLAILQPLINEKLRELDQTIQLRQTRGLAAAKQVVLSDRGKRVMDQIRGIVAQMQQEEEVLLELRSQQSSTSIQQTTLALSLIAILTLLLLLGVYALITRDLTRRKRAEAALQRSAQRLAILHDIDRAILEAHSSIEIAQSAVARLCYLVPCRQALVLCYHFDAGEAQVLGNSSNGQASLAVGARLPLSSGFSDPVLPNLVLTSGDVSTNGSQSLPTTTVIKDNARPVSLSNGVDLGENCVTLPLRSENTVIGELKLFGSRLVTLTPEHREITQEVANQLAIALEQAQLRERLQQNATELECRVLERTAQLQSANTELEAFGYSVSHDLRAPLRAMQGFTQALMEDYNDVLDGVGQDYARRISKAAQRMDVLIEDLLAYSRLSRAELELKPIDLDSLVSEVIAQLELEIRQRQAQIIVVNPLLPVIAHRVTLVQVLTNLLMNAIKFVASGVQPQIKIWAEARPEARPEAPPHQVRLWVQDNGIGIAPEHQERIFRVFERLHGVETYPGTGIGLAIVRKGVERMGGQVGVESNPSVGSRFWLELPKINTRERL